MTWTDPRKPWEPLVKRLSDGQLCDLVAVIHFRLCIPIWFTRTHLEELTGQEVSESDWDSFLDWFDGWGVDERSEQLRNWWGDYKQDQTMEGDHDDDTG
jgi:hypothetical protein